MQSTVRNLDLQTDNDVFEFGCTFHVAPSGSQGIHITFAAAKANKAEPTLALKPRGYVTRNPKQGYQWPKNRTCEYVFQKRSYALEIEMCICNSKIKGHFVAIFYEFFSIVFVSAFKYIYCI